MYRRAVLRDIRNRKSYRLFQEAYNRLCDIDTGISTKEDYIRWLYDMLDVKGGWGSRALSEYARESLVVFLKDLTETE